MVGFIRRTKVVNGNRGTNPAGRTVVLVNSHLLAQVGIPQALARLLVLAQSQRRDRQHGQRLVLAQSQRPDRQQNRRRVRRPSLQRDHRRNRLHVLRRNQATAAIEETAASSIGTAVLGTVLAQARIVAAVGPGVLPAPRVALEAERADQVVEVAVEVAVEAVVAVVVDKWLPNRDTKNANDV